MRNQHFNTQFMNKYLLFLAMLSILSNCINPEDRGWIIPVTIDDSILLYTPKQMEGFQKRRAAVLEKMEPGNGVRDGHHTGMKVLKEGLAKPGLSRYTPKEVDDIEQLMR